MAYSSYKEKRMYEKYKNFSTDTPIRSLHTLGELSKYNPKAFQKVLEINHQHDTEKKRIQKLVKEAGSSIVNIATKVKNPTEWRVCSHRDLPDPSPAEQLIINQLDRYKVKWYREVEFMGLKLSKHGLARYDFLIETPKGIHILEYDSALWHNNAIATAKDYLKTAFCNQHKIPITRYSKQDYYHMEIRIKELMEVYKISKK